MKYLNEKNDLIPYWDYEDVQGLYVIEVTFIDGQKGYYIGKAEKTDYTSIRVRLQTHNNNIRNQINNGGRSELFYREAARAESVKVLLTKRTYHRYSKWLYKEEAALIQKYRDGGKYVLNENNEHYYKSCLKVEP